MVLASKVYPNPLKFLSKEGQNSTLRATILNHTQQPGRLSVTSYRSARPAVSGIGCTLEAKTTVSNSTYCYLLIGDFKTYTVSGVTFPNISRWWADLPVHSNMNYQRCFPPWFACYVTKTRVCTLGWTLLWVTWWALFVCAMKCKGAAILTLQTNSLQQCFIRPSTQAFSFRSLDSTWCEMSWRHRTRCHSGTSRNFAPSRVSEKRTPGY